MKKRSVKKAAQVLAFSGILCTMACGTALARDLEYPINSVLSNHTAVLDELGSFMAVPDEDAVEYTFMNFDEKAMEKATVPSSMMEYKFIYEDGTMEISADIVDTERASHFHNYVKGNYVQHNKHKDGSCTETIYAAHRCTVCGATVLGDIINTINYQVCIH